MNPKPESPRFLLILGSLFLLAYAAYHLGAAWMDSIPENATAIGYITPTPSPTITLTPTVTPTQVPLYWITPTFMSGEPTPTLETTATLQAGIPEVALINTPTPTLIMATPTSTSTQESDTADPPPEETLAATLAAPTPTAPSVAYPGPDGTPSKTENPYPGPGETPLPTAAPDTDETDDPYPGPAATATPRPTATATSQDEKPTPTLTPSPTTQVTAPGLPTAPIQPTSTVVPIITTLAYSETLVVANGSVNQVIWSQDDSTLVLATSKGLYLYDAATLKKQRVFDPGASILSTRLTANDGLLVTGGVDGTIRWWDLATTGYLGSLSDHLLGVVRLDLPDFGNFLASASDDATVRVWDISTLYNLGADSVRLLFTFRDPVTRVMDLDVNPDGQMVAAASQQHVHIWNSQSGALLRTISQPLGWYTALTFSPDSQVLTTAYDGRRLEFWNTLTWERIKFIPLTGPVQTLACSPDGFFLVVGFEDGRIQIWDVRSKLLRADLIGYPGLTSLDFNALGNRLATSSADGSIRIWDLTLLRSP
jgi:hypothetical protein